MEDVPDVPTGDAGEEGAEDPGEGGEDEEVVDPADEGDAGDEVEGGEHVADAGGDKAYFSPPGGVFVGEEAPKEGDAGGGAEFSE